MQVTVIGAGILGSSIAMNLAQRGCKVTVLEAADKPAAEATGNSWAWLNANRKEPLHYKELNTRSMNIWRTKFAKVSDFPGSVVLGDDRPDHPQYASQQLTADELVALEPELGPPVAAKGGRLYAQEGMAYPAPAAELFLHMAQQHNADIHYHQQACTLEICGDKLSGVRTQAGLQCSCDAVVLACGIKIPELAASVGVEVPLVDRPGTWVAITEPLPPLLNHIIVTDAFFMMQRRDGAVLMSLYSPAQGPDQDCSLDEAGKQVLHQGAQLLPRLRDAKIAEVVCGKYPCPKDCHPICGFARKPANLYVAVTHSGMTLAPLLGQLVAQEILHSRRDNLLEPYGLDRNFEDSSFLY